MNSGKLDRRLQFRRAVLVDTGLSKSEKFHDHGSPVFAARQDVSDSEKFAAGAVQATLDTRFTVRSSPFTRDIEPSDRLTCEGLEFNIIGIKQIEGRKSFLEISCKALVK
ncbi:hypothetical protein AN189_14900 [Loktanella sp. 3ANDIMAR09]|nr:hypothetical protein AN189_14900 [Loktanella sp. 3ANDIMAR09]